MRHMIYDQQPDGTWRKRETAAEWADRHRTIDPMTIDPTATVYDSFFSATWDGPGHGWRTPPAAPFTVRADGLVDLHPSQWSVA